MRRARPMGCIVFCNTGASRRTVIVGGVALLMLFQAYRRAMSLRGYPSRPMGRPMVIYMRMRAAANVLQPHRSWARHAAWSRFATERRVH